jgi:hypothetical protein
MHPRLLTPALLVPLVALLAAPALGEPEPYLNTPPKIIVTQGPAVLLVFDGAPAFRALPGQDLAQAMNTPFLVLKDRKSRLHWLTDGTTWFSAKDPLGPWAPADDPPARITELAETMPKPEPDETAVDAERPYQIPQVITTTEPAELIAFDGDPAWAPLAGDDLLVAVNTSSTVLRMEPSDHVYVLLSGRWFESASLDGPWNFVRPDQLPAQFSAIPADSEVGRAVRAQVAGTPEAEAAVADSKVPVTVDVDRSQVEFEATYYGSPDFEPILGTKVSYAVNSPQSVLWIGSRYYACAEGAWYVSRSAEGPWEVADEVPPEVQTIPPSSPLYNLRYVQVVESTPEVVTFNVLPGYYGSYDAYGTVIYGTGYCYPAWHTPVYYVPRPCTWGFGFAYDPWFGSWAFGNPWCSSFWSFGVSWGHAYWPYYPWGSWYGGGWGCHPYYGYGWGGGYYGGYGGHYGHGYSAKGKWRHGDYAGGHGYDGRKGKWNHDGQGYYGPKGQRMRRDDWIASRDHKPQGREGRGGRGDGSVWNQVERGKRVSRPAPIGQSPGTKDPQVVTGKGMKSPKLETQAPPVRSGKGPRSWNRGAPATKPGQGKGGQSPSGNGPQVQDGKGWQASQPGKGWQSPPGGAQSQAGKGWQGQPNRSGRSWGNSPSGKSWGNAQRGPAQGGGRSWQGGGGAARSGGRGGAGHGGGGHGGGRGGGHGGGGRGR